MLLTIPVKPHVLKFLREKYPEGYTLNERDHVGSIIYTLLRRQADWKAYEKFQTQYSENFEVEIPEKLFFNKSCRHLTHFTISKFNSIIESIMRDQCIYHLYLVRDVIPVKHEIYKWLELYDIDEGGSFNYLSISKSFQRFCEEKDGERKDLRKLKYKPKLYLKKEDLYYLWSEEAFERVENLFKAKWREIKKEKTLFLKNQVKYSKFNSDRYLQELEASFEKLDIQHLTEKKMC